MSGILDLLNSNLGKTLISGLSNETNLPADKMQNVLTLALPVLMEAMKRNASTPQGAESLLNVLGSKHDGRILENLGGLFNGGVDAHVINDGSKILGHVLGGKQQNIQNAISQKSGIDANTVAQILKVAAPIIMGYLGNQAKQQNVNNPSGLEDLLGGLLGSSSANNNQDFLTSMLDANGDGSIIDDVAGMVLGSNKSKGGLGGLLGGLFGKK